ncbi:MAG: hypothetical protein ACJ72W_24030 [Actinoallomurus sp.]
MGAHAVRPQPGRPVPGRRASAARPGPRPPRGSRVPGTTASRWSPHADEAPAPAMLVRPDGYVAWAGENVGGLRQACGRWFGAPRGR